MQSLTLVCEPLFEGHFSSQLYVILNLDYKQVDKLLKMKEKVVKAARADRRGFQHLDRDEELAFWLSKLPSQFNDDWTEGEVVESDASDDYQWRVFVDKELDETQMNLDLERIECSSIRLMRDGFCFSAYMKHNPTRNETAVISWKDLLKFRKRFPQPIRKKRRKVA